MAKSIKKAGAAKRAGKSAPARAREPDETPQPTQLSGKLDLKALVRHIKTYEAAQSKMESPRADMGNAIKAIENLGFNKNGIKAAIKIANMEEQERNAFLESIDMGLEALGCPVQMNFSFARGAKAKDDFEQDPPRSTGGNPGPGPAAPANGSTRAGGDAKDAAAGAKGRAAGAAGKNRDSNPYKAGTTNAAEWDRNWAVGQGTLGTKIGLDEGETTRAFGGGDTKH